MQSNNLRNAQIIALIKILCLPQHQNPITDLLYVCTHLHRIISSCSSHGTRFFTAKQKNMTASPKEPTNGQKICVPLNLIGKTLHITFMKTIMQTFYSFMAWTETVYFKKLSIRLATCHQNQKYYKIHELT